MARRGRAQQHRGGVDGAARQHHHVGRVSLEPAAALDLHRAHAAPGRVGLEPGHARAGQEGHVRVRERGLDADRLRVCLALHQAREAVACVAADAGVALGPLVVEQEAERERRRVNAGARRSPRRARARAPRGGSRDSGTGGSQGLRSARRPVRRARARGARPLRSTARSPRTRRARPATARLVAHLAEVAGPHAQGRRAPHLGVAADGVLHAGLEGFAALVVPGLVRVVAAVELDRAHVPVLLLARQVLAALEQEDALPRRRQPVCERASTRAAADHDHVPVTHHASDPPGAKPQKMQRWRDE